MFTVSPRSLKRLAGLFWYAGAIALLAKGGSLLIEAETIQPNGGWPWLAAIIGLCLGGVKARFLFVKVCHKNLSRIRSLEYPKLWQFFRPRFFVFLAAMILIGVTLSRAAHTNYPFLLGVGILDLSIAVALLGSSYPFWTSQTQR